MPKTTEPDPRRSALRAFGQGRLTRLLLPLVGGLLAGCTAVQLNRDTLDLAATVGSLQTEQVLENLGRYIDSGDAIPAQVVLAGGTVQVNNVLNPGWVYPYGFLTLGRFGGATATKEFHLDYTNQWVQNWNLLPVSDSEDLARLRALYRYAVYGDAHDCSVRCSRYDFAAAYGGTFVRDIDGQPHPIAPVPRIHDQIRTGWLYWSGSGSGAPTGPARPHAPVSPLGTYRGHTLYTTSLTDFSDFVIAVLGATVETRALPHTFGGPLLNP
jgi:hypothetical protein